MNDTVNVAGLSRPAVIQALYAAAAPLGMGFLQFRPGPLPDADAQALAEQDGWMDYVHGRPLKVKFEGETFISRLYDREYGPGAAQRVVDALRAAQA